jgi:hypothetical protein
MKSRSLPPTKSLPTEPRIGPEKCPARTRHWTSNLHLHSFPRVPRVPVCGASHLMPRCWAGDLRAIAESGGTRNARHRSHEENMIGKRQATKQNVVQAILFPLFFFGALFLIPFFPGSRMLQALNANGACIVLLAIFAACTTGLISWITFRKKL